MNLEKFTDRAQGLPAVGADRRDPDEPSADRPRAPAQGAARGRAGHGRGADRARRRQRRGGAARDRRGAGQDPGRLGRRRAARRRGSTTSRARARPGRADRRRRPATATSPSSGCCSRWRSPRPPTPARRCKAAGLKPEALNAAINELRGGRTADTAERRGPLRRAEEVRPRPHRRRRATASSIR